MELEKTYVAPDGFEVHGAWYGQKWEFRVFKYPDGSERIVVWDNDNQKELFSQDFPKGTNMNTMIVYIPEKDCNWCCNLDDLRIVHNSDSTRFKQFKTIEQLVSYLLESKAVKVA